MTAQERDYEEILGRALHSATDQIEPVGDGLTKIRARLTEPWLKRQWWLLRSELMVLRWLVVVRSRPSSARPGPRRGGPFGRLRQPSGAGTAPDAAASPDAASGRWPRSLRPVLGGITAWAAGKRPHKSAGPAMAWLRPALAVAGAVVLVVAGVFALGGIRGTFVGLENDNPLGQHDHQSWQRARQPQRRRLYAAGIEDTGPAPFGCGQPRRDHAAQQGDGSPSACSSPSTPPVNSPSPSPTADVPEPVADPDDPEPVADPDDPEPVTEHLRRPLVPAGRLPLPGADQDNRPDGVWADPGRQPDEPGGHRVLAGCRSCQAG